MVYRFGPFELDEEARSLTLRGATQKVQPRIFDLLAYLVKNGGRVVPKDELMDALWPNLNVTEASLQRVVSLARSALAAGGLDNAIRSYVRHGYRFGIDNPTLGEAEPPKPAPNSDIELARRLAKERDWVGAASQFSQLAKLPGLDPADLDLWAFVKECQGRPVDAIPILERTVTAYVGANQADRAGRAATTLAKIHLECGASEVAVGWLERADFLLKSKADENSRGYLLWMKSRLASSRGDTDEAIDLASRAYFIAEQTGNEGLRALALSYLGFYNLSLGRMAEGIKQQNHAAAISLSGEIDPITGSLVYCSILWSCRTFADWTRALQWSDGFESWCDASFAEHPGTCDLHRAEIIGLQKNLTQALDRINLGLGKLSDEQSWSLGEGYRIRGDVQAMIGNLDAARSDYAKAYAMGWDAEPGNSVLLLESGDVNGALSALERAIEGHSWFHLQRRGLLLAHRARIAALGGRPELAMEHLAELDAASERWSQPPILALVAEARAALCKKDDPHALRLLVLARQLWTSGRIDFHAARVRLKIADLLLDANDGVGAEAELRAVEQTATRIGSNRLAGLADTLRRRGGKSNQHSEVKLKTNAEVQRSVKGKQKISSS
jgi:DNA-binding winged helix-turn-helix (wHTH) protein